MSVPSPLCSVKPVLLPPFLPRQLLQRHQRMHGQVDPGIVIGRQIGHQQAGQPAGATAKVEHARLRRDALGLEKGQLALAPRLPVAANRRRWAILLHPQIGMRRIRRQVVVC